MLRSTGAERFARRSCALVVVGIGRLCPAVGGAPASYKGVSLVRLAAEARGLGILDTEGLSVKVMVVAGLAAGGATGFLDAIFLTTTLRLRVSF